MEPARRKLVMQALAWGLTICAGLLIWWATGDDEDQPDASPRQSTATQPADSASTGVDPDSGLSWVVVDDLPPEVSDTLAEIEAGPPYPYDRDGITFENREGLLPDEENGYYQEFTVETPGSSDRGARRVIWGLEDELYYTDDHYESFERIVP